MSADKTKSDFIADLSWPVYEKRLAAGAIVLVPVGANEQHGYHLPLGTDTAEVRAACLEAAKHLDVLIAPIIPFGYASQTRSAAGNHWPGNISLQSETLVGVVSDVLRSLLRHGATRIAVIDAHYENGWYLLDACEKVSAEIRATGSKARIVKMMCWDAISKGTWDAVNKVTGEVDLSYAHAGVLETAAMLHAAPDHVDMVKIVDHDFVTFPPYDIFPQDPTGLPCTGCLSSPRGSTPELGRRIIEDMGQGMARLLSTAFDRPAVNIDAK
jgi:creatinine amidohydrolase